MELNPIRVGIINKYRAVSKKRGSDWCLSVKTLGGRSCLTTIMCNAKKKSDNAEIRCVIKRFIVHMAPFVLLSIHSVR